MHLQKRSISGDEATEKISSALDFQCRAYDHLVLMSGLKFFDWRSRDVSALFCVTKN